MAYIIVQHSKTDQWKVGTMITLGYCSDKYLCPVSHYLDSRAGMTGANGNYCLGTKSGWRLLWLGLACWDLN